MRGPGALAAILAAGLAAGTVSAQVNPESEVTLVAPLIISPGVPVPQVGKGAPLYTAEQIRRKGADARDVRTQADEVFYLRCLPPDKPVPIYWLRIYREAADAARRVSTSSRVAQRATEKALRVRIQAQTGAATQAQVEAAELERQAAVIELVADELDLAEFRAQLLDVQDLVHRRVDVAEWPSHLAIESAERGDARRNLAPKEFEDLALENIQVSQADDGKASYYKVSGSILNTRPRGIAIPPIAVTAVDAFGYPLLTDEAEGKGRIGPGETKRFTFDLKPSPPLTSKLIVTFARAKRTVPLEPPRCLPSDYPDHMGTFAPLPPTLTGKLR